VSPAGSNSIRLRDLTFDHNGTGSGQYIGYGVLDLDRCRVEFSNQPLSGLISTSSSRIRDCEFVGGGTSCDRVLILNEVGLSRCHFSGAFGTANEIFNCSSGFVEDSTFDFNSGSSPFVKVGGSVSNLRSIGSVKTDLAMNAEATRVRGLSGFSDVNFSNRQDCLLADSTLETLTFESGSHRSRAVNVRVTSGTVNTSSAGKVEFFNCDLLQGALVPANLGNVGFFNCQIGPDGGGSAYKITINSGAALTKIIACMLDAATVDNGTNTQFVGNREY
jgi:hypothetical protein